MTDRVEVEEIEEVEMRDIDYHIRKMDQHYEMAALARDDGDKADEARHLALAEKHKEIYNELRMAGVEVRR